MRLKVKFQTFAEGFLCFDYFVGGSLLLSYMILYYDKDESFSTCRKASGNFLSKVQTYFAECWYRRNLEK